MYADAKSPAVRKEAVKFMADFLRTTLRATAARKRRFQLSAAEIEEAIEERAEIEKGYFINKLDVLDPEARRLELMKKRLKIGDWAVGTVKNLFTYDADFFEFERAQRAAMGLPEFGEEVTGVPAGAAPEDRYGFFSLGGGAEEGYDHRAAQDEDVN